MSLAQETEMSDSEVDEFLGRHETGVLSLARSNEPYSIPISYGYNADARTFFVRLVSTPESEKRQFLSSSPQARIVVYEESESNPTSTYRSVVGTGALEEISPSDLTVEHIEQYGNAKRPLFEIWGQSKKDLNIQLYTLNPDELSGRRTEIDRNAVE
ncbi:pyridoxamine 5'-phosphate oxidase-like FMN-binding protein [Halogeometricum pallidum JCM 14848]|uniref:Pyridoxamine 5'-phosphate oxidase-like FMN-binding protein n=1 Tax=Halogeometricum pallidum JCM 14848 TaxID=1227487 RepID=M0D1M8_HALPD|nr:pyridoxamine 5'-phosphate oxidase family protein [Halogeometricum pallidum]ELZ28034.1 pyridoxamine 5'-phosphate oxidase-like FMN-binding protein [Halogeometricum pallidum JCM 14848]